jgi:hypothetical protein
VDVNRRNLLATAGTIAGLTAARTVLAQDQHAGHAGYNTQAGHDVPEGGKYKAVEEVSAECVTAGQECLRHCLDSFAAGDTALAGCARSVR